MITPTAPDPSFLFHTCPDQGPSSPLPPTMRHPPRVRPPVWGVAQPVGCRDYLSKAASDGGSVLDLSLRHQGDKGSESSPVERAGIALDSGGKQRSLIKALKAFSLALILLSCSVALSIRSLSFLTRKISLSICLVRSSISRTGRQLSIDNNCRHRGGDAGDSPLLGEGDGVPEEGEVVIGGKESDQTEHAATQRLGEAKAIQAGPGTREVFRFWPGFRRGRRVGCRGGIGHKRRASTNLL